jgi:hypothetical protein
MGGQLDKVCFYRIRIVEEQTLHENSQSDQNVPKVQQLMENK